MFYELNLNIYKKITNIVLKYTVLCTLEMWWVVDD